MDAMTAKTRYRRRQLLRLALADVYRRLGENVLDGIRPDAATARLMAELLKRLVPFAVLGTQTDLARILDEPPDPRAFAGLLAVRRRERQRKRRRRRPRPAASP